MAKKSPRRKRRRFHQPHQTHRASVSTALRLENLEQRLLLDVAGWWDELGLSGASGGGITRDEFQEPGEIQLVQSGDSDPVAIWVDGTVNEFVDTPITYDFYMTGDIYARQFAGEDLGWWDLTPGSGDTNPIGTGSQIAAAAGPNGQIVVVWVADTGGDTEIYARMFNGTNWIELSGSATDGGLSNDNVLNERPDVAVSDGGEIFVSYTAIHPVFNQGEIVVKKFTVISGDDSQVWTELVNEEVGEFAQGENEVSGLSADVALSFGSAIAIDMDRKPIVVWTSILGSDQAEIYARKWDGNSWEEFGLDGVSDTDEDGLSGISSDASMSIQPDIAVTNSGEVIVTWVGWNDWQNYDTAAQAGIYVKSLQARDINDTSSGVWFDYTTGSASGQGIAPQLAWYYNPQIDTNSQGRPLIVYQGFDIRFDIDRDRSGLLPDGDPKHAPGSSESADDESPNMAVYVSNFNGTSFQTLSDNGRNTANPLSFRSDYALMPNVLIGPGDELILGFTWFDTPIFDFHQDSEIFIQQWDNNNSTWTSYGRASNINGNDLIGDFPSIAITGVEPTNKLALLDFDNDPDTEHDVVYAKADQALTNNDGTIYRYNRQSGTWSLDANFGFGQVFDIKSEPEVEFNVAGNALIAFLDDTTLLPKVYEWAGGQWNWIGGTEASDLAGNNWNINSEDWGITVQAGPNGQVFLAYLRNNGVLDEVVTRLWDPTVGVWADAGTASTALANAPLVPVYHSIFDGVEFTDFEFSTLTLADVLETLGLPAIPDPPGGDDFFNGSRTPNIAQAMNRGDWNFDIDPNDTYLQGFAQFRDLITGEANVDAGITGTADPGFLMTFTDQEDDDDADDTFNDLTTIEVFDVGPVVLAGELQHQFELVADSDLVIELSYQLETTLDSTGKLDLFLVIDNQVIDTVVGGAVTPIHTIPLGNGVDTYTTVSFDTKALGLAQYSQNRLHTLAFRAEYSSTGTDNGTGDTDEVTAMVRLDNIAVYQRVVGSGPGTSTWEILDADVAGNGGVGPGDPPAFDFQADIHASLTAAGTQIYTIDDVQQISLGDMGVSFRYRADTATEFTVKIDGIAYDETGDPNAIPVVGGRGTQNAWWNGIDTDPGYNYVQITAENIAVGTHTVTIEVTSTGAAVDLRIDNLTIFATPVVDAVNPIATLMPSASDGQKEFALGITAKAAGLSVYATQEQDPDGADDPFPDGPISIFFANEFDDAYYTPSVFILDSAANSWGRLGLEFVNTTPIDFSGVGTTMPMPTSTLYRLEDLAIGPNSFVWMATLHATSDWVDINDPMDGIKDQFDVHPFVFLGPLPRWNIASTLMDVEVWSWQATSAPLSPNGGPRWKQQFGSDTSNPDIGHPLAASHAYSNPALIGSANQLPTLAWTERDSLSRVHDSGAQRFQTDGTWGVLGTESVQNTQFWSTLLLEDMIVNSNGYPIVAYNLRHLDTDGIREFRAANTVPDMRITESSDIPNDDRLDFGATTTDEVSRAFNIINDGQDDLLIYSVQFGGYGTLASNPFSLGIDTPEFPIIVKPGASNAKSIKVIFDPENVPAGDYSAVLVINNSDPQHPTHPFSHFYEVMLDVSVLHDAEIDVEPEVLVFADTSIDPNNNTSPARLIKIINEGEEDSILLIDQWYFNDNNYRITKVVKTTFLTGDIDDDVDINNDANDVADDVQLAFGDTLEISIVFEPSEVEEANEIFYIASDDSDEPLTAVFLTGKSFSGAEITVEKAGLVISDEAILDFGSVLTGTTATITLDIRNTGATDLIIFDVLDGLEVTVQFTDEVVIAPDGTLSLPINYMPLLEDPENSVTEVLEDSIRIFSNDPDSDPDSDDADFEVNFIGLAVPPFPLISTSVIDDTTLLLSSLDFGPVPINTSRDLFFQINNIGGANLAIDPFILIAPSLNDGAVENPFTVSPADTDLNIAFGGDAQVITITFNPTVAGTFSDAQLSIASNGVGDPVIEIFLFGSSTNPVLDVTDSQGNESDRRIDFGNVGENLTSVSYTITLRNSGDSDLSITNWTLTDPDDVFTLEPFDTVFDLKRHEEREIEVFFSPDADNNFAATVTVSSNDPNNITADDLETEVDLLGVGVLPGDVGLDALVLDFDLIDGRPHIAQHDTSIQTFTITNTGLSDLILKGLFIVEEKLTATEHTSSPFSLSLTDKANVTRSRLDPDDSTDDILLVPEDQQLVSVNFIPANSYDDTVYVKIITTDKEDGSETVNYVDLVGKSVLALKVGFLNGRSQRSLSFFDYSSDLVQVKLTGGGHALVILDNNFGWEADIAHIELIDTTDRSRLTITTRGQSTLGQITGGTIKNITLKNVVLDGHGLEDGDYAIDLVSLAGTLKLDDITGGADIRVAETSARRGIKITAADIDDDKENNIYTEFQIDGDVNLFKAINFVGGKFFADNARNIKITGAQDIDSIFVIDGLLNKFSANKATFTGALQADTINKASLYNVKDADISVRRELKSLTIRRDLVRSRVLGGYDLGLDARLGGGDDQLFAGSLINSIRVRGMIDDSFVAAGLAASDGDFFNPDSILSGRINKIKFGSVEPSSDDPYGVAASTSIFSVKVGRQSVVDGGSIGDFEVHLL